LQLATAEREGLLKPNDLIAMFGIASGLSAGTALLRWRLPSTKKE
jgi:3-oxoacyl-[acyl-carrier-protein] synthase III